MESLRKGEKPLLSNTQKTAAIDIGDRLREIRERVPPAGLSRDNFACRLPFPVHKNTIARYETGQRVPDATYLLAVCKAFKVNPTWLLTGEGPRGTEEPPAIFTAAHIALRKQLSSLANAAQEESSESLGTPMPYDKIVAYIRGQYLPSEEELIEICRVAKADYVAVKGTGRKAHPSEDGRQFGRHLDGGAKLDAKLLQNVVEIFENTLSANNTHLPAKRKAELIVYLYRDFANRENEVDTSQIESEAKRVCSLASIMLGE